MGNTAESKKLSRLEVSVNESAHVLQELREIKSKAGAIQTKLFINLVIWAVIFQASFLFTMPVFRDFYERRILEPEFTNIALVITTFFSGVQTIGLGITSIKMSNTLSKASRNYRKLSESLYQGRRR